MCDLYLENYYFLNYFTTFDDIMYRVQMCAVQISIIFSIFKELVFLDLLFHFFTIYEPISFSALFKSSRWTGCIWIMENDIVIFM